jgi:hypothetical protein
MTAVAAVSMTICFIPVALGLIGIAATCNELATSVSIPSRHLNAILSDGTLTSSEEDLRLAYSSM